MWLSATGDHRHVGAGGSQEEAERPADSAEPRDPERRSHDQLRATAWHSRTCVHTALECVRSHGPEPDIACGIKCILCGCWTWICICLLFEAKQ